MNNPVEIMAEDIRVLQRQKQDISKKRKALEAAYEERKSLIKDTYDKGLLSQEQIAKACGVKRSLIWQILHNYKPKR
jgi:transcriptional regulator with XRE-family HTH domain